MSEINLQNILDAVLKLNTRLDRIDNRLNQIDNRLLVIEKDISELRTDMNTVLDCISHENAGIFPPINGKRKKATA